MTEPRKWLEFARQDLVVAQAAFEAAIYNHVCFHAQQGVEKALKGFLHSRQQPVPRTHVLRELLARCYKLDAGMETLKEACVTLDGYYIPTRYPEALPGMGPEGLPTRQDAEEAVAFLREALDWIEGKIA